MLKLQKEECRVNEVQKLIKNICIEQGIKFQIVSKDWVIIMQKDSKVRYISGYKFPLNNHAAGLICDDKYALYDVLNNFNIDVCKYHILFKNYNVYEVIRYASKYDFDMVVKSNISTCGNDMYHTFDKEALFIAINELLKTNYSISVCPYYNIKNEYRTIILDNRPMIVYGKNKPIVIGDGKSTIYQLLCVFNPHYFKNIIVNEKINQQLNKVLEKGKIYEYNWQFNLSKGAMPFVVNDNELKGNIEKIAINVAKILNVCFISVDVVRTFDDRLLVLEVNSGIAMDNLIHLYPNGYNIANKIYTKAIIDMFE